MTNALSEFLKVDEALYLHEAPFYRYCACGAGSNPNERSAWRIERERLTELRRLLRRAAELERSAGSSDNATSK